MLRKRVCLGECIYRNMFHLPFRIPSVWSVKLAARVLCGFVCVCETSRSAIIGCGGRPMYPHAAGEFDQQDDKLPGLVLYSLLQSSYVIPLASLRQAGYR